jgi:cytochrome P450
MNPHKTATTIPTAPGRLPLLGHATRFARHPLEFLASLPAHGNLVRIYLGTRPVYVVCQPEATHRLLLDSRTFDKGGPFFDALRQLLGNGVGTSTYEPHRRQRLLLQPAFHRTELRRYAEVMTREINEEIDGWPDGAVIDIFAHFFAVSTRAAARTLFVTTATDDLVDELSRSLAVVLNGIFWRMADPTGHLRRLPTPGNRRYDRAERRLHAIVDSIIAASRPGENTMLSRLLAARDDDGTRASSDEEIHDHVVTFLFTGTEVPIAIATWAVYLLARHPETMRALAAETGAFAGRTIGFDDLPGLVTTRNILTETLRLYPTGWLFSRVTTRDTELAGHAVQAGTPIFYSPYLLHRRAGVFDQPDRFDPDRWLPERIEALPSGAYVPFGGGARKCIGDNFGFDEATIFLATLAARCRWDLTSGATVRPRPRVALNPTRFSIHVRRR